MTSVLLLAALRRGDQVILDVRRVSHNVHTLAAHRALGPITVVGTDEVVVCRSQGGDVGDCDVRAGDNLLVIGNGAGVGGGLSIVLGDCRENGLVSSVYEAR